MKDKVKRIFLRLISLTLRRGARRKGTGRNLIDKKREVQCTEKWVVVGEQANCGRSGWASSALGKNLGCLSICLLRLPLSFFHFARTRRWFAPFLFPPWNSLLSWIHTFYTEKKKFNVNSVVETAHAKFVYISVSTHTISTTANCFVSISAARDHRHHSGRKGMLSLCSLNETGLRETEKRTKTLTSRGERTCGRPRPWRHNLLFLIFIFS